MDRGAEVQRKWRRFASGLDERQRRLWAASEAREVGAGGIALVAHATGLSEMTVRRGLKELKGRGTLPAGRVRRPGGGRKQLVVIEPKLLGALDALIDPHTRGDPMSPLRWCSKSVQHLSQALKQRGFRASPQTVWRLLLGLGFTLHKTRKTKDGEDHPDRDAQFQRINELVREYQARGEPVVSVDTKKKENVGNYANGGREWQPAGEPDPVKMHDFPDPVLGKVIPYGLYDQNRNEGFVSVGVTHDTPEFAVAALRQWWQEVGHPTYPKASRLLITADCGGSNGARVRTWKTELLRFAQDAGIEVRVAHFPPGTSKWNKIEHRMFCHITHNWRGRPLVSREVVLNLIGSTTTSTGLRIRVALDPKDYATGLKISDKDFAALPLVRDEVHGDWNYRLGP
jgi:transposase